MIRDSQVSSVLRIAPLAEQQQALDLFRTGKSLRIDAFAGTGKTTLRLLAESTPRKGLYLAFNRSIAEDARTHFPGHVFCSTAHSIAFRIVIKSRKFTENKLTGSLTANLIAEVFRFPVRIAFFSGLELSNLAYAAVLISALRHFLLSNDAEPMLKHFSRIGVLETVSDYEFDGLTQQALSHMQGLWAVMQEPNSALPLTHDGYLKLWALSRPQARVDYVMVDEAQDLNPVLIGVLSNLSCPVVYVGILTSKFMNGGEL